MRGACIAALQFFNVKSGTATALMILIGEKNRPSEADYDLSNSGRSRVEQVEDWSKSDRQIIISFIKQNGLLAASPIECQSQKNCSPCNSPCSCCDAWPAVRLDSRNISDWNCVKPTAKQRLFLSLSLSLQKWQRYHWDIRSNKFQDVP